MKWITSHASLKRKKSSTRDILLDYHSAGVHPMIFLPYNTHIPIVLAFVRGTLCFFSLFSFFRMKTILITIFEQEILIQASHPPRGALQ